METTPFVSDQTMESKISRKYVLEKKKLKIRVLRYLFNWQKTVFWVSQTDKHSPFFSFTKFSRSPFSPNRSHGQGSRSLHWYRQESQGYSLSLSLSLYLLLNSELGFGGVGGFFSDHTKLMLFDESCNWSLFVFCRSVVQGLPQWPEVHRHHLLAHWSCECPFFSLFIFSA